jgi:polyisoprenoid-binding protein YceI
MSDTENLGTRYRVDARQSSFTVQTFATGLLSFVGHNPTFAVQRYGGEFQFAKGDTEVESMLVMIQAETISLLDEMSEKDTREIENTMHGEVLETKRFPEIAFVSKDVSLRQISNGRFAVTANGNLSLHGESRPQTIKAEAEINGNKIRAEGEFLLDQSDFNIKQTKALGGTLKVKNEVKISFDITAQEYLRFKI